MRVELEALTGLANQMGCAGVQYGVGIPTYTPYQPNPLAPPLSVWERSCSMELYRWSKDGGETWTSTWIETCEMTYHPPCTSTPLQSVRQADRSGGPSHARTRDSRTAAILLLALGGWGCAPPRPAAPATPMREPPTGPSLFAIPRDSTIRCSEDPRDSTQLADSATRWTFIIGSDEVSPREVHLEASPSGTLAAIADITYRGRLSEGGAMITAAAVFSSTGDRGIYTSATFDFSSAASTAGRPRVVETSRALEQLELTRARLLGDWLLSNPCLTRAPPP